VNCLSVAPAFQDLQLSGKIGDLLVEFGGLAAATPIGNQRHNDGWQAHHHPPKQEQQYVFHLYWLGKYGELALHFRTVLRESLAIVC
jgi:hypothetical protein